MKHVRLTSFLSKQCTTYTETPFGQRRQVKHKATSYETLLTVIWSWKQLRLFFRNRWFWRWGLYLASAVSLNSFISHFASLSFIVPLSAEFSQVLTTPGLLQLLNEWKRNEVLECTWITSWKPRNTSFFNWNNKLIACCVFGFSDNCLHPIYNYFWLLSFLPHCMQCRCGVAMRILSVRLSVYQTPDLWQNGSKISPDFYIIRKVV